MLCCVVLCCVVLCCVVLSCLVLCCLVLSYIVLSFLVLSCHFLPCFGLSVLVLSCPVFVLLCLMSRLDSLSCFVSCLDSKRAKPNLNAVPISNPYSIPIINPHPISQDQSALPRPIMSFVHAGFDRFLSWAPFSDCFFCFLSFLINPIFLLFDFLLVVSF